MSRAFLACLAILVWVSPVRAQQSAPAGARSSSAPFEVLDNSFLVEEAFNQDPHIFQNIFNWQRDADGAWNLSFTQEWPLGGITHQFSYTLPVSGGDGSSHLGDVLLNYRYQLMQEGAGRPAIAPRISAVLPTGDGSSGDRVGIQTNVALSKQFHDIYLHGNAGFTWIPTREATGTGRTIDLLSPQIAGSVIWRATRMLNLMLESVVLFQQSQDAAARLARDRAVTISPGFRYGWNIGDQQIVLGAAIPITTESGDATTAVFAYASYELPFAR